MSSWCIALAERFEPGDDGASKKNRDGGPDPRRCVCRASPGTSLWCVSGDEASAAFPGDEIVPRPMWVSTRGVTIAAPPREVWPWIVQMGYPAFRAGWYTPHWLDRLQWGISESSSERIRPELQGLEVGDRVPDSRDWSVFFTVERLEPERLLVLRSTRHLLKPMRSIDFSWTFALESSESVVRV